MTFRKIFGALFLIGCLLLPQAVSAEKTDWSDKNYNFRGVRDIVLLNVTSRANIGGGNIFYQRLQSDYVNEARKMKCSIITEDQARRMTSSIRELSNIADLYVECTVKDWSDDYYIVPARTVWERKEMRRHVRDRNGDRREEIYYETVPVTYPPYRVDVSKIAVSFEVYDTRTGQMVFGREDIRDRNDKDAQTGMYGRICKSFFQDLGKKIK